MIHPLLIPRYICTGPEDTVHYPGSPFTVGQIITLDKTTTSRGVVTYYAAYPPLHGEVDFFDQYPHLFRRLHWWEFRELGEMPEYVKLRSTSEILKVVRWERVGCMLENIGNQAFWEEITPATLSEYEAFKNERK